jgi:hypothetical protein
VSALKPNNRSDQTILQPSTHLTQKHLRGSNHRGRPFYSNIGNSGESSLLQARHLTTMTPLG